LVNNYVIVISVAIVFSAASVVVLAVIVVVVVDAVSAAPVVVVVVAVGDIEYYNSSKNATLEEVEPRFTFCMVEYLFSPCVCCSECSLSRSLSWSSTLRSSISDLKVMSWSWRCLDFSKY